MIDIFLIAAFVSNFPARTCIQVAKLPLGALVEIEAIAYVAEVNLFAIEPYFFLLRVY